MHGSFHGHFIGHMNHGILPFGKPQSWARDRTVDGHRHHFFARDVDHFFINSQFVFPDG